MKNFSGSILMTWAHLKNMESSFRVATKSMKRFGGTLSNLFPEQHKLIFLGCIFVGVVSGLTVGWLIADIIKLIIG